MAAAGADLIILEMMADIERMLILLAAAQKTGLPVWIGFSCDLDDAGQPRLLDGQSLADAAEALKDKDVPLIAIMHTEVEYVAPCLEVLKDLWQAPIAVYAHSGKFIQPHWIFNDVISPEDYAAAAQTWQGQGVQVIGGCCGIGLEHIQLLKDTITDR